MLTIHPGCNMNLTGTAASSRERTRRAIGSTTSLAGCGRRLYWASELSMYCELCTSSLRNLAAASLGDTQLRRAVAGLRLPRPQAEITAHRPALGKAVGIFQGEHVGQRDQRPNALHLLQQSGLRILFRSQRAYPAVAVLDLFAHASSGFRAACNSRGTASFILPAKADVVLFGRHPPIAFTVPRQQLIN